MQDLHRADRRFKNARFALNEAIQAAASAGVPARIIARKLELSPGFVKQILATDRQQAIKP